MLPRSILSAVSEKDFLAMLRVTLLALAVFVAFERTAHAQNAILAQLYGQGVHAYYSGDSLKAYDLLTKAIDGGINDPRAYYFRGLACVAAGREFESEADYRAGADLEAKGNFGPAIGQALARIQGAHRMAIENMRQQAQLDYQTTAAAKSKARYQAIDSAGSAVLREKPVPAAPVAPPKSRPAPPAAPPAVADDPFATDNSTGSAKVESKDVLADSSKDPFADDAAPAAAGGNAPAAGEDPFGGGAPAAPAEDPFGGGAAAPPAAGTDPFGGGDASDPFAN
jgi:hypothetical protein